MIPFMTEDIYQNLVRSIDKDAPESIHLCDFPVVDEAMINPELEKNMAEVLKIVVLGRAARNSANIKNRQPIGDMYVKAPFEVPEELWNQNDMKYIPVTDPENIVMPQERITPEKVRRRGAENPPEYMVVQGGLTDAMVKTLIMSNTDLKGKKMVLLDGSKILLSSDMYEKLQIKGLRFEVADALQLLGVTINPFSAY